MICPNYKNKEVKEQFNEIIEALGGKPLTDEEFRSSDLRDLRQGVDYSAMEAAYKIWHRNNGNPMDFAPNGESSILFLTYLDHFDRDRKQAIIAKSKVYSDAFINWFGDWINDSDNASKVVDENGEPLVVYHFSDNNFSIFDKDKIGTNAGILHGPGFYFSKDINYKDEFPNTFFGDTKYLVFLNIRKPLESTSLKLFEIRRDFGLEGLEVLDKYNEYDGVFALNNKKEYDEFVAWNPNQIKSATDNKGLFSRTDDDIIGKRRYVSPSIKNTGITTSDDLMAGGPKYNEHGHNFGWSIASIYNHLYTYVVESVGYSLKTRKKHVKDVNALYGTNFGVYKDKKTGLIKLKPNTKPLSELKLTKNPYDTQQYLYQQESTDYSTEYHDIRDYLKENGIEKTELRKLKSIKEPLNSGTKSLKKMRERLELINVDQKLIDAIIEAIKLNPNIANLQPFIIYKLLNRQREEHIARDYNKHIKLEVDKRLEQRLMEFLKPFGVEVLEDGLAEEYGVKGIYDILHKFIHIAKDRNRATLTEEAAHAIVRLLGASVSNREENREYTLLFNIIESTSIYKQVYELYKDTYTKIDKDGNKVPDITKIKEEAIGQALAVAINNKWEKQDKEKLFWNQLKIWFEKLIQKYKDFENKFNEYLLPLEEAIRIGTEEDPLFLDINKILDEIAIDVLNNNTERFKKVDDNGWELQSYSKTLAEQSKKDGGLAVEFLKFFSALGNSISGSLSYRLQGTVYRKGIDSLHDIDMRVPASAHDIYIPEFIERVKGWMAGPRVAAEYPYFLLIMNEYPEMRILAAYEGINNTAVVSMVYSKDVRLSERFISFPQHMSYKQRLDLFTEEELNLIYLFDFFLDPGEIDFIHDDEYNISLDPHEVSFDAKLKIGRAKDIYDYQMFKVYRKYRSDKLSDKEHLLFQKTPQLAEEDIKIAIEKGSKRLEHLYDDYNKTKNKTKEKLRIQSEIFELRLKIKNSLDYLIIADVLLFAISRIGSRLKNSAELRPDNLDTVWGRLYLEDKKDNDFADVTPAQLMDDYRNVIKFLRDLFDGDDSVFNSQIIEDGAYFVSDQVLIQNRENLEIINDAIRHTFFLWKKAMIAVTNRIVSDIIDEEVDLNEEQKENMKQVTQDYLHKNQMHGDIDGFTAWMFNYGQMPHPVIKQAFHLIQHAETQTLEELHPEATKLSMLYRRCNNKSITARLDPNWQTLMMEKDKDGKYTGNFIRDINYGLYELDYENFIKDLCKKFDEEYGHHYVEDESGFIVNSVTGELAQDEEWIGYDEPVYVKYLKKVYEWKCEHANLRYTFDYYNERLSKPYDGDEDPNAPGIHIAGHGLSPKTLARYDYILTNINYYLDLCRGEDGFSHPEDLSPEEQWKLDQYKQQLEDLRNPLNDDGSYKSEEEKRIAFEIRAWERWLSQKLSSDIDLEGFLQAEQEVKQRSINENNPKLYIDFIKYNATFGINPNFIDQTIGMFDKAEENSIILVKARLLKSVMLSLIKTSSGMTRDFRKHENNIQFWISCKDIDQTIEDNKEKLSKSFAEAYSHNFDNKEIYYQDLNGTYYDIFGNPIPDPEKSGSNYPTMTWFDYMVDKYTNIAKTSGTIPGLLDSTGNPASFVGYSEDQIRDFVTDLFTYTVTYEDENGDEVQEQKPLSIFTIMYPKHKTFINKNTGKEEPTVTTIPTNKFKNRKNNVYNNFININYDKKAGIAEQPKRFDDFGRPLYDNSENYFKMRDVCGDLYDALVESMKKHQKDYGSTNAVFNYRLPLIEAETAAILSRLLKNGFKNSGKMLLASITTILENDIDMKQSDQYLFDSENHIKHRLPLRYIRKLKNPNAIGTDVTGNVILFLEMAINYKNKEAILDKLELLQAALERQDERTFGNTKSRETFNSMMAKHVYGEQWQNNLDNQPPSISEVITKKAVRNVQSLETINMLGVNILSMSVGFFDSIIRLMRESMMFKYMTPWDLTKSIAETMFRLPLIMLNIGNPVPNNKIGAMMQINGLSKDPYKTYSHMNRGRWRKVISNILMGGFSMLDYITQATTMNAFYKDYMFYDGDLIEKGFYNRDTFMRAMREKGVGFARRKIERMRCHVTLWDAYKYDKENHTVYIDPKYEKYVTQKVKTRVRTKSILRGALYNGMNPDNDIARYRLNIWLSIVFAMRGWLVQLVQHLFSGGDEVTVRQYEVKKIERFKRLKIVPTVTYYKTRDKLTDEQRANRMAWNYETGTPMDEIYKGLGRSINTLFRLICRTLKYGYAGWKSVKFSEVEMYAWRDALVSLACLILCMIGWIPVHEWAKKVIPVKNRKQAGVLTINTKGLPIINMFDVSRYLKEEYINRGLYKMLVDDVMFRVIEALLANMDPITVMELINTISALKNGFETNYLVFNVFLDTIGLTGKDPNEVIKNSSSYKYYTRKERFLYRFNPVTKNLHSAFTYWGLRQNEKFYIDSYGYLYRMFGYEAGWGNTPTLSNSSAQSGRGSRGRHGRHGRH